ncbi:universal stress protein [Haloplanus aerogenes]|uniref:HPP family protein n=1 Tax=Haloplanus aerogenes TaxID=660522 RepID=A0A3M0CHM5_9EURY|nr:HPP family protein [Haloplanus aerogenes]AZH26808.1 HPP family protein [Haloplanus aerogenes]RMB09101.1 nucleotide-binding universal stress UspA family protein [Haloplanus aerogenes]
MFEGVIARLVAVARRMRRLERRELAAFGRWLQHTGNLLHLTVLVAVPLLIGLVTLISNALTELSFLLFPPLASGAYTLFADPEGRYASPRKFVVGLVVGACCGWAALGLSAWAPFFPTAAPVSPASAALSIFLTGAATWLLDVEEPAAFSTALLVLVTDDASPEAYVTSVAVFGALVAVVFSLWRSRFYERRAQYLYDTAQGDDHVLVPMRGDHDRAETTALFGATLAAAHDAGKVVLLAILDESAADADVDANADPALDDVATETAERLEATAETVRTRAGVPCEVVVASGAPVPTTVETAANTNCDLVVTPYEEKQGLLSPYVRGIFDSRYDTIAFRPTTGRRRWRRILVTVARPGDTAHAMLDFAARLAGRSGTLSVCTCIDAEVERRGAETRLADLAETVDVDVETRVARSRITDFIGANADAYDLLLVGSSGERSRASRFVSPPTFERLHDVDCDVAVIDRGHP